jgi:cobalt-zinc-cadmium efflux system outer membrane protein
MTLINLLLRIRLKFIGVSVHTLMIFVLLQVPAVSVFAETASQIEASPAEDVETSVEILSLSRALSMAIAGSPVLEEFSWDMRASEARVLQAGLIPNPEFSYQLENITGSESVSAANPLQSTYMLSQLIELGGKRSARKEVASLDSSSKKLSYERKRMEVLGDVANKFHHVAADQERLKLAQEEAKLTSAILQNIRVRVNSGKSSSVEENKARVLQSQLKIKEEHTEHELASAKLRLASTWGAKKVLFKRVENTIFTRKPIPSFESLSARLDESPGIQQSILERRARMAEIELAKAGRVPDVTVGVGFRHFDSPDDNAAVVQLSVPLPLFNRSQHRVSEARSLHSKADAMKRSTELSANEELFELYQELNHTALEMEMGQGTIIPEASQALKVANEGFKRGSFSYLELSDVRRIFFEAKLNYIEAALEYHNLVAEIEKLLGISISDETNKFTKSED